MCRAHPLFASLPASQAVSEPSSLWNLIHCVPPEKKSHADLILTLHKQQYSESFQDISLQVLIRFQK